MQKTQINKNAGLQSDILNTAVRLLSLSVILREYKRDKLLKRSSKNFAC